MPIACALIPREDLRPDQLEMLGTAMERWYWQQFADFGVALWIDYVAVTALRMGEMPQPLALRRSEGAGAAQSRPRARPPAARLRPTRRRR